MDRKNPSSDLGIQALLVQGWPTPRQSDKNTEGFDAAMKEFTRPNQGGVSKLAVAVQGWTTPTARDHKDTPGMTFFSTNPDGSDRNRIDLLPRQVLGTTASSSDASNPPETEAPSRSGGALRLNPHFSRWLMGFPAEWSSFAATETPSSPNSPRSSSERTCKRWE